MPSIEITPYDVITLTRALELLKGHPSKLAAHYIPMITCSRLEALRDYMQQELEPRTPPLQANNCDGCKYDGEKCAHPGPDIHRQMAGYELFCLSRIPSWMSDPAAAINEMMNVASKAWRKAEPEGPEGAPY